MHILICICVSVCALNNPCHAYLAFPDFKKKLRHILLISDAGLTLLNDVIRTIISQMGWIELRSRQW